jgi:hypothetical protein
VLLRRHHKLRVLIGGWWRKENRPPPHHMFCEYEEIPPEAREFMEKCARREPCRPLNPIYKP